MLDLLARERRVAVGVQQALLGRDEGPLAVDEERAALQYERGLVAAHPEVLGDEPRDLRVAVVRQVLLAPRVEPEVDERDATRRVPDEDRTVVAHPRVVDREREDLDAVAAAPADLGLLLGIADHDDGLEGRDRVGHRGVVALGLLEPVRPERLARQGGPFHQARLVRLPLGRHRKAVLARGGLLFAHRPSPLIVWPSLGRPADRSEIAAPLELVELGRFGDRLPRHQPDFRTTDSTIATGRMSWKRSIAGCGPRRSR